MFDVSEGKMDVYEETSELLTNPESELEQLTILDYLELVQSEQFEFLAA